MASLVEDQFPQSEWKGIIDAQIQGAKPAFFALHLA